MWWFSIALAHGLALAEAPPSPQNARGAIEGRVDVRLPSSTPRSRPTVRESAVHGRRGVPDRRQSVVYLETAPQGAFEEAPRTRPVLDQRRETFVPYVLPVRVGTTVAFPNSDPFYHNVFSLSKTARFDLGRYPMGESKSVRFERPGIVRVFCEIHSHMSAFVLVLSHQYFAATASDGRYRIEGVPPGEYDVVVWTDGEERGKKRVRVGPGATAELDFVVEPARTAGED
ncbi:MAG TPA: carboxypeptidase regulatory-like domain-containing protein [Vicinamibacteria bacterium]|jgi:plastocyanin